MKKNYFLKTIVLLLSVIFIAGLALSCDDSGVNATTKKSTEKELTTIKINDVTPEKIPDPISADDLAAGSFTDGKYTVTVYLPSLSAVTVTATASDKAAIAYGTATGYTAPAEFSESSDLGDLGAAAKGLYVRVTAEDGSVNYYRFAITPMSNNTNLSGLTVGGTTATVGTKGTSTTITTGLGTVALADNAKDNAKAVGTTGYSKATVDYALTTTDTEAPTFAATDTYNFADGYFFWVRVTAENGIDMGYYKFNVEIGRNAALKEVWIGSADNGDGTKGTQVTTLGTPRTSWGAFTSTTRGDVDVKELLETSPTTPLNITTADASAKIQYAIIGTSDNTTSTSVPTWIDYTADTLVAFTGSSHLAINVTSANGKVNNYYRISVNTKNGTDINYGSPKIWDPADATNKKYIDPIWNDDNKAPWLDITRVNKAESYDPWFGENYGQHTSAQAKVLWDDTGIYVYLVATFNDYKTSENGATITRVPSLSVDAAADQRGTDITNMSVVADGNAYQYDSLEVFINERLQQFKSGDYGNQYRVGLPNAEDGTITLSGEKSASNANQTGAYNNITKFQLDEDKTVNSWVTDTGYIIIMRAPFVKYYNANIDQVFDSDGKVKPNAQVGLELQINACATAGTRNGILTWNGITGQSYQNVANYGIAKLVGRP